MQSILSSSKTSHIQLKEAADRNIDLCKVEISRPLPAMLTPIKKLPVEVLGEIFSWDGRSGLWISQFEVQPAETEKEVDAPALAISHTCSLWRKIALSILRLWSTVVLDWVYNPPDVAALIGLYLDRSEPALLTLDVTIQGISFNSSFHGGAKNSCIWSILQSLLDLGQRWESTSFRLGPKISFHADSFLSSDHLYPNMKSFFI
ncbi:hypothetical protein D9758_002474 [Tetrapyrgos nigripes]|uniref:F-box domain-containing protein n=1 Tax=Tetrapyrgos nigripes TaxID=182062 RepID=A0A8H5GNY1_9AGAR|nr:hypothetical protein D9758_002474 [Tetrapyrgos nigripes]